MCLLYRFEKNHPDSTRIQQFHGPNAPHLNTNPNFASNLQSTQYFCSDCDLVLDQMSLNRFVPDAVGHETHVSGVYGLILNETHT